MKTFRTLPQSIRISLLSIALATGSFALAGCSGAESQPTTASSKSTSEALNGDRPRGPEALIQDALADVKLRPDQKTEIDSLLQSAKARHQGAGTAHKELMGAVAGQIEKGSINRAELQPSLDKVTAEMDKVRSDDRAALVRLHSILDKDQRNAFVDALESKIKSKMFHGHRHGGPEGENAKDAPKEGPKDGPRGEGRFHGPHGGPPFLQIAEELKLTDAQRDQIRTAMMEIRKGDANDQTPPADPPHHGFQDMKEFRDRAKAALDSFRTDTFTPDALPFAGKPMGPFAHGVEGMVAPLEKIVPILTPEQRTIAATKLRERAAAAPAAK